MSIIPEQDFLSQLYIIQSNNPPSFVLFPEHKEIYNIDLESRKIDTPEFLSVVKDHNSSTIYFRVKRFYHYTDLSKMTCIIQYTTLKNKQTNIYTVPFYDIITELDEQNMLFAWCIDKYATPVSGPIEFSIRFYSVQLDNDQEKYELEYNLNTVIATSEIKESLDVTELSDDFDIELNKYLELSARIDELSQAGKIYWDLPDELYTD